MNKKIQKICKCDRNSYEEIKWIEVLNCDYFGFINIMKFVENG